MIDILKQPRQDLDLCGNSFARFLEKHFTQIYRAFYRDAMLVPIQMGASMNVAAVVSSNSLNIMWCKIEVALPVRFFFSDLLLCVSLILGHHFKMVFDSYRAANFANKQGMRFI